MVTTDKFEASARYQVLLAMSYADLRTHAQTIGIKNARHIQGGKAVLAGRTLEFEAYEAAKVRAKKSKKRPPKQEDFTLESLLKGAELPAPKPKLVLTPVVVAPKRERRPKTVEAKALVVVSAPAPSPIFVPGSKDTVTGKVYPYVELDGLTETELEKVPLTVLRDYARIHLSIIGAERVPQVALMRRIAHVRAPVGKILAGWPYTTRTTHRDER